MNSLSQSLFGSFAKTLNSEKYALTCSRGFYNLNDKFIYIIQRVFGANAERTVANADGSATECNNISSISHNDTTNPTKPSKVHYPVSTANPIQHHFVTTTTKPHRFVTTSVDNRRANWWTGLSTMWNRVATTLRMQRKNFTKLTCMRRRRERSDKKSSYF